MKKLITLLILISIGIQSFSQIKATTEQGEKVLLDKDGTWTYVEKDNHEIQQKAGCDYTTFETNKITLKRQQIGKTGVFALTGFLEKLGNSISFYCSYEGDLGHVDKESYCIVKFEDNSTLELKSINRTDHRTPPVFIANINDPDIFSSKKAIKIKLVLSKNFADVIFMDNEFFIKSMACLE